MVFPPNVWERNNHDQAHDYADLAVDKHEVGRRLDRRGPHNQQVFIRRLMPTSA
jgi:hypothetical protein